MCEHGLPEDQPQGESLTEHPKEQDQLHKLARDLGQRAKESQCLYRVSALTGKQAISLEEIFQKTVELIPAACQYPEVARARITLGGQEFKTEGFEHTAWRLAHDILVNDEQVGSVQVCYLEQRPESDDGPFSNEEKRLIAL